MTGKGNPPLTGDRFPVQPLHGAGPSMPATPTRASRERPAMPTASPLPDLQPPALQVPHAASAEVCVILPVFRPEPEYLRAQMASLAGQTVKDVLVVAVIADRQSGPLVAEFAAETGVAVHLVTPDQTLDTPRAVEAGLAAALPLTGPGTRYALCDQDDIWHPMRLERGLAALAASGAALAHGDARLVDEAGRVLHPSMFRFEGRTRRTGLRTLLLRNSVTGMTATFTRTLAALSLPFPAQSGVHYYHDLWLALLAQATDGIAHIDDPLVDYRQHGANVMGALDRRRVRTRAGLPARAWLQREAARYALARYLAHCLRDRVTEGVAVGIVSPSATHIAPLRPYLRRLRGAGAHLGDALALAATGNFRLARRSANVAVVSLGRAIWTLREAAQTGVRDAQTRFDARLYGLSPGVPPRVATAPSPAAAAPRSPRPAAAIVDLRKTPRFAPAFTRAAPSVCVLVPTLNPTEVFAGITTAIDIGAGLAGAGHEVTFIATDLPIASVEASMRFVIGRLTAPAAAAGASARIRLFCGVSGGTLPAHPADRFLATAWWSAHVADTLITAHGYKHRRFHYLIQDYEPMFYAWGPEHADALASYALPFEPIFNSTPLRDYFAAQGHAFATPDALVFHPAVELERYATPPRPLSAGPRRLALYGRPEVARNMFPTAIEALSRFLDARAIRPGEVELLSVGLLHDPVALGRGHVLHSLGKLPLQDYPGWLLSADIGLSLMLSPHPSHPPLEMAAAGLRVVTNRFATKDLSRLTPAILSVAPTAEAVAEGLCTAWDMGPVAPAERRFDLSPLGAPLDRVTALLAARLGAQKIERAAA